MISFFFFFFNDTATTEIYTLSLHDALPIYLARGAEEALGLLERVGVHAARQDLARVRHDDVVRPAHPCDGVQQDHEDRKSTRLNSSHSQISYAVFCLKKQKDKLSCDISIER